MIIDCDPGHDDAIALMLAHRHAEVLGITTVSGNAPLAATTGNALQVKALLGMDAPVHAGAARPLVGEPVHAMAVHGESGLDGVERIEHSLSAASDDAVGFLLDAAARDVWIVAIGPLTNVALAIERDPAWPQRIAGLSIMGGSTSFGNATPAAEFNIYADPEAAARVFASGAKIVMCGLNLTHQLRTDDAVAAQLRASSAAQARFAAQIFDQMHKRMATLVGRRSAALHDPCAVLAVTHPWLLDIRERHVDVECAGELTRGMTVVDQRTMRRRNAANAKVAYRIDAAAAMAVVVEALGAR
jgi:inosine-uridine nucleoside N-ribohydrolase